MGYQPFVVFPGLENDRVEVIVEELVKEGVLSLAERIIFQSILGPPPKFVQAKNRGICHGLLEVGVLDTISSLGQSQPSCSKREYC